MRWWSGTRGTASGSASIAFDGTSFPGITNGSTGCTRPFDSISRGGRLLPRTDAKAPYPMSDKPVASVRRVLVESALLLGFLVLVPLLVTTSARRPWDFETYWYAARAVFHGLDPYSKDQMAQLAGRPLEMPFIYAPVTIPVFVPFTLASFWDARWVWLG